MTLLWDAGSVPAALVMTDNTGGTEIDLNSGKSYTFENEGTRTFTINTRATIVNDNGTTPTSFKLEQNYPNPFNPLTILQYALPVNSNVRVTIHNMLGQQVAELVNHERETGWHTIEWDVLPSGISSGVYFYRIEASEVNNPSHRFVETKKMLLLR